MIIETGAVVKIAPHIMKSIHRETEDIGPVRKLCPIIHATIESSRQITLGRISFYGVCFPVI